jgi:hypothetical protein
MGFSLKNIGKFIDALDEVTDDVYKELSVSAKKTAKSANQRIGTVYNETSKQIDKGLKQVGRFVDNHYEYLKAADDFADSAIDAAKRTVEKVKTYVVNVAKQLIDIIFIKEQVKQHNPQAFRALILEKKKDAVDVGIFDNGKITERLTINSDVGVSNNIYRGQIIEIYS